MHRSTQLAGLVLAAMFVAVLALSPVVHGADAGLAPGAAHHDNCCCVQLPPQWAAETELHADGCCPKPAEQEDCPSPCQSSDCPCSCCKVMSRTVNLFSIDRVLPPLYDAGAQRLSLVSESRPASAALSVDIQPPIA